VEVAAKPRAEITAPTGYQIWWQECFACFRDFAVSVPVDPLGMVTLDVPCPHCHRHKAEVLIGLSSGPIYVAPTQRSWMAWRVRRVRQRFGLARRILLVSAWRVGRFVARLFVGAPTPHPHAEAQEHERARRRTTG
jgi:hypothetical protein